MSLTCELSGEVLSSAEGAVVVTPSGHLCVKRLLLTKLAENGGMDPFTSSGSMLTEDQLVTVHIASKIVPPRTSATSMPAVLTMLQHEYDALALELFDTRQALEDTRKELSQALYQNDAAVRVVARLAVERDAARQELQQQSHTGTTVNGNGNGTTTTVTDTTAAAGTVTVTADEPSLKKRRLEESQDGQVDAQEDKELPLKNNIPAADMDQMVSTWETLHKGRKARQKQAAAAAPAPEALVQCFALVENTQEKSWHKTSCKGVTAMASHTSTADGTVASNIIVTAGKDKQTVVYDCQRQVVLHTVASGKAIVDSVDLNETHFVMGTRDGKASVYSVANGTLVGSYSSSTSTSGETTTIAAVVHVQMHPDGVHVCVATSNGQIALCAVSADSVAPVAVFSAQASATTYTTGALHPDGLIYAAGTATGDVLLWDFCNKSLASTLTIKTTSAGDADMDVDADADATVAMEFSNNGYHLAVSYASGLVRVWDLRKQTVVATVNKPKNDNEEDNKDSPNALESVETVSFDDSGKYLAYGGIGGIRITTVKEWGITAQVDGKLVSRIVWGSTSGLAACSEKKRNVTFYGVASLS
jgi:pre-mRNA-processing factor 19